VSDVRQERGSSWTLTLTPEGHAGLRFLPGQFAWLTLRSSPFSAKEHPFSFSGSAEDSSALRFTIKELGDFTSTIKDVQRGETAYVDGPHGIFSIDHCPRAESFVFVAGGVGIAPIISMLRTLADRQDERRLRLIYGNWRWSGVLFREDLELLRPLLDIEIIYVLQDPPPEWGGLEGVLSEPVMAKALPDAALSAVFFLCGPKPMSDSVHRTLRRRGVPLNRIHCELFDMA
jgi:predicted ferric reductase